jgi:hypothetical protein
MEAGWGVSHTPTAADQIACFWARLRQLSEPWGYRSRRTVVMSEAREALTYSTTACGNTTGGKYNVFIMVETI